MGASDHRLTVMFGLLLAATTIETDFGGIARDNKQVNAYLASTIALGRVDLPDDIGGAVAMLLSPDAGWITGQRIEVSGGTLLQRSIFFFL